MSVQWQHPTVESLKNIANGGEFDLAEGIRAIAQYLVVPVEVDVEMILDDDSVSTGTSPLSDLVGERLAAVLADGGFVSVESVKGATDEQLLAVKGIGETALVTIREKVV